MSAFPSASIILFIDPGKTDQQIWDTVRAVGKCQWRAEILLVADSNVRTPSHNRTERITYRPIPHTFDSLASALDAAKHPLIAIVDRQAEFDPHRWQYMVDQTEHSPIQSSFQTLKGARAVNRFFIWLLGLLVRLLLGTRKSELNRGVTLLTQTGLQSADLLGQPSQSSSPLNASRLLGLARLNGQAISETEFDVGATAASFRHSDCRSLANAAGNTIRFWWNEIMFPRTLAELPTTKQRLTRSKAHRVVIAGLLLVVAAFVLMGRLNYPLFEPDEARNAQLAMNIIESGDWLSLTLAEENYWDKPPFQIWAIAASYRLLGESQFATRLPGALAALLTLSLCLLLGQKLVGFRSAWIGSLLLLLTAGFVLSGRYVTMDASLTAMATAALLSGYLAIRGDFKRAYATVFGLACGLGLLIKGPVIGVICVPPLMATLLLNGNLKAWLSPSRWLWAVVPTLLVSVPWFLATALIHPDFLTYFFWKHHIVRFSSAFNHREPIWYYFVGIFLFMFPASYLLPSVTRFITSRKPEFRWQRTREHGFLFLSAIWVIVFFSISESKLPTYIIPAFPPICLLIGVLLESKLFRNLQTDVHREQPNSPPQTHSGQQSELPELAMSTIGGSGKSSFLDRLIRRAPFELLGWVVLTCIALVWKFELSWLSVWSALLGTLILVPLAILALRPNASPKIGWTCFGLAGLVLVTLISHSLIPQISRDRSIYQAASQIQSNVEFPEEYRAADWGPSSGFQNAPVVFYGRESHGIGLNLDLSNVVCFKETQTQKLVEFLQANRHAIIVSSKQPMKILRQDLPWTLVLEECPNARHLYISHPNHVAIAREQAEPNFR